MNNFYCKWKNVEWNGFGIAIFNAHEGIMTITSVRVHDKDSMDYHIPNTNAIYILFHFLQFLIKAIHFYLMEYPLFVPNVPLMVLGLKITFLGGSLEFHKNW